MASDDKLYRSGGVGEWAIFGRNRVPGSVPVIAFNTEADRDRALRDLIAMAALRERMVRVEQVVRGGSCAWEAEALEGSDDPPPTNDPADAVLEEMKESGND